MASAQGTATLDFGAGSSVATVAVVGQAAITASDAVGVWWMGDFTADHSIEAHLYIFPLFISLAASLPTLGVGFTITASTTILLTGTVKCRWAWSS